MIGRKSQIMVETEAEVTSPQGFDDFEMKLGDVMRGERATLGKSLLDVQRELRIKASYIAAIENCDPSAFDTPGFIAGYVRSYARYLNMDPEEMFAAFCAESGFSVAHGMSEKASTIRKPSQEASPALRARDPFADPALPFTPRSDGVLSRIEPGAIGSTLVLLALVGGIGYGGWAVLQEIQQVQLAPVEQTPLVLSELDPIDAASPQGDPEQMAGAGLFTPPAGGSFDRLYRPEALDVPILTARDAPISTLDPDRIGAFAGPEVASLPPGLEELTNETAALVAELTGRAQEKVLPEASLNVVVPSGVTIIAARPSWIRVQDEAGTVLETGVMNAGDTYEVPSDAVNPVLRVGESGAVYFAVNGRAFGPSGAPGSVTDGIALSSEAITERYALADLESDGDLDRVVAALGMRPTVPPAAITPVEIAEALPTTPEKVDAIERPALPQLRAYEVPVVPERPRVEPVVPELDFADLQPTELAEGVSGSIRPNMRSDAVAALGAALDETRQVEEDIVAALETDATASPAPETPQPAEVSAEAAIAAASEGITDLAARTAETPDPIAEARANAAVAPDLGPEPVAGPPSAPAPRGAGADAAGRVAAPPTRPTVPQPQVLAEALPGVTIVALHEAWIEVTSASGTKLYAETMLPGDTISVPQTEEPPVIFTGDAGAVYFLVGGQTYGPYGERGQFGRNLLASANDVRERLAPADLTQTPELARVIAELAAPSAINP